MNDPFHAARLAVQQLGNPELTLVAAVHVLRAYCAEVGVPEVEVAEEVAKAASPASPNRWASAHYRALCDRVDALHWTEDRPTKPGLYWWRRKRTWPTRRREVRRVNGQLVVWAQRVRRWVPLATLDNSGAAWFRPDVTGIPCLINGLPTHAPYERWENQEELLDKETDLYRGGRRLVDDTPPKQPESLVVGGVWAARSL